MKCPVHKLSYFVRCGHSGGDLVRHFIRLSLLFVSVFEIVFYLQVESV